MQIPVQITFRGIAHSDALETAIRARAAKLEHFDERITRCRIVVEQLDRHKSQGRQFAVRIDLHVPDNEIAVTREHDEDVNVALRDAFDAARRMLDDGIRTSRREAKARR